MHYTTIECVFRTKSFTIIRSDTQGERSIFYAGSSTRLLNTPELRADQEHEKSIPRESVELYSVNSQRVKAIKLTGSGCIHQICGIYADNADDQPTRAYHNGITSETSTAWNWATVTDTVIGDREITTKGWPWNGWVYAVRLYDRALSGDEIKANAALDIARFI